MGIPQNLTPLICSIDLFIERLKLMIPGLDARLPTEAEWEYACRAGTTTPFSFGVNITPEQANYNGKHPYADGAKGLHRGKTVLVKSLPSNPWGLYEMHGNVFEWCADWAGDYAPEVSIDPPGPKQGTKRVLRGGCWYFNGRFVRSAFRGRNVPAIGHDYFGFRLALGQTASGKAGVESAADADRRSGSEASQRQERERVEEAEPVQQSQDKNFLSRLFERIKPK